MRRPLSREEARALYQGATQDHVRVFILTGLATGARPEAITDRTWDRISFTGGIIRLNPDGRVQTKKYRPQVIAELQKAYAKRQGEHVIMFRGKHVHRLDMGREKARKGLPGASRG
ncbi:hypothetical protein [Shinella sp. G-2]|uniref:hypothetical protein n=1 Tax=Shinella sp. G-2 TaxID=3133141 RepID=UPI003D073B00